MTNEKSLQMSHSSRARKEGKIHHHIMKFSTERSSHQLHQVEDVQIIEHLNTKFLALLYTTLTFLVIQIQIGQQHVAVARTMPQTQGNLMFPGVSRDLSSFCAARPSLPIDLASMVVHVKKNISFNYKLYLFSTDYVFQTGQVIPRDDFRIHSFPVKLKRLNEFWPENVPTYQYKRSTADSLTLVSSTQFNLKQFFALVPLNPKKTLLSKKQHKLKKSQTRGAPNIPEDAHGESLPGDPAQEVDFISHDDKTRAPSLADHEDMDRSENHEYNKHIQFDRDDQLSSVSRRRAYASNDYLVLGSPSSSLSSPQASKLSSSLSTEEGKSSDTTGSLGSELFRDSVLPVGSFSSFKVNLTYLVRKDFDQLEPQLIRIQVDSSQFMITQLDILNNGSQHVSSLPHNEDYDFLSHKLLRDLNTRVTAINQIYEDWITRNFYTIVYIQRRLEEISESNEQTIVNDRLVFRGTSIALLGADQLDYSVKAATFITEKNGLHYYFEFLNTGKFYLCAVDWTKRPFKIIDSKKFPIKATRTQLDNEELLLCPPSVCYSTQPVDEVVSYGRISLADKIQRETSILSMSLSSTSSKQLHPILETDSTLNETNLIYSQQQKNKELLAAAERIRLKGRQVNNETSNEETTIISLDNVIDSVKAGSAYLQTRLHLRDWVWILSRAENQKYLVGKQLKRELGKGGETSETKSATDINSAQVTSQPVTRFELRYELARRNDIKVKPDTYGYVLTGHEIDASYRVYNELYLISANHLITINYTLANETVIHTHPIGDEFFGLSSTLIDPITGAFYDRYANQVYFFKTDRYVGYDYATKKPLEDFLLQPPADSSMSQIDPAPLVSTLPVVGILGRQHQVDGIYHDFFNDFVYVFTGMKFYTFPASEFKNGSFRPETKSLPKMHCTNERFLSGCNFDQAYQNPCQAVDDDNTDNIKDKSARLELAPDSKSSATLEQPGTGIEEKAEFNEEQQMKLRKIATTRAGLLNLLGATRAIEPLINETSRSSQAQEKIFVYLLIVMVVLTILVSIAMIVLIANWTRLKFFGSQQSSQEASGGQNTTTLPQQQPQQVLSNHYLSNQRQIHSHRHPYRTSRSPSVNRSEPKPLGSVNVVVSKSRRHMHGMDNSAL